ncbi:MAG: hypothetical protein AAF346_22315, partial [Pseudomonadota bacterium]
NSQQAEYLERYNQAFKLLGKNAKAAREILGEIQERFPQDGLVGLHLTRIGTGEEGVQIELESK